MEIYFWRLTYRTEVTADAPAKSEDAVKQCVAIDLANSFNHTAYYIIKKQNLT